MVDRASYHQKPKKVTNQKDKCARTAVVYHALNKWIWSPLPFFVNQALHTYIFFSYGYLQPSGSWEVIHEYSSWWHVTSACTNLVPFGGDVKTDGGGDGGIVMVVMVVVNYDGGDESYGGGDDRFDSDDKIVVVVMTGLWWWWWWDYDGGDDGTVMMMVFFMRNPVNMVFVAGGSCEMMHDMVMVAVHFNIDQKLLDCVSPFCYIIIISNIYIWYMTI